MTYEVPNPGIYPKDSELIPYYPRREFQFMPSDETTNNGNITIDSMRDMSVDQIVELYKNGYRIENTSPTHQIATAQDGISISSGAILLIGMGLLAYTLLKR